MNLVSIIVTWNSGATVFDLLEDLHGQEGDFLHSIVVIDNNSADGIDGELAERFPGVRIIANKENTGFSAAVNQALQLYPDYDYYLLVNPDIRLPVDILRDIVNAAESIPDAGISGCRLLDTNGISVTKHSVPKVIRNIMIDLKHYWFQSNVSIKAREYPGMQHTFVEFVSGSFFLIKGRVVKDIGYFDERFWAFFEEADYCVRAMRRGWKIILHTSLFVEHLGGASFNQRPLFRRQIWNQSAYRFFKKYHPYRAILFYISIAFIWSAEYFFKILYSLPVKRKKAGTIAGEYLSLMKSLHNDV